MSRLRAAMQRAATGVVAPLEQPVEAVVYEGPTQQVDEGAHNGPPEKSGGGEPYIFRELNKDYTDAAKALENLHRLEAEVANKGGVEGEPTADPLTRRRTVSASPLGISSEWRPTAESGPGAGCNECATARARPSGPMWVHRLLRLARIRRSHCSSCGRALAGHAGARAPMTIDATRVDVPGFLSPEDGLTFSEIISSIAHDERAQHDDEDSTSSHHLSRVQGVGAGALADGKWRSAPPARPNRHSVS